MTHSLRLKYTLYGVLVTTSLSTFALQAASPDGVFGDYFTNMTGLCVGDQVITGFSNVSGSTYGTKQCTSLSQMLGSLVGNLGIGTLTPGAKLEVAGDIKTTNITATDWNSQSTSLGAIKLNAPGGSIIIDDAAQKRISWNDGDGNFNIRGGNYYKTGSGRLYAKGVSDSNGGAATITLNTDNTAGNIFLATAPTGIPDTVVNYTNQFIMTPTVSSFVGGSVGIGTGSPAPGVALEVVGSIRSNYLEMNPQNVTDEGGELRLRGTGIYGDVQLDNFQGNARIHTLATGKILDILGGSGIRANGANMNNNRITSLADPVSPTDAATKNYVDTSIAGISWKNAVTIATTTNITLSGLQTIDGYVLIAGDRVLVKNQTTASQNGLYVASSAAWSRSSDADTAGEIAQMAVYVKEGTTQKNTGWVLGVSGTIVLGTTPLTYSQFTGGSSYVAGTGINITGNTVSLTNVGTAGTYTKVTTDAQGRVTNGTILGVSDIPSVFAQLTSPNFTGVPTAPTAPVATNTTQIATTAFVKSQGYLTSYSESDPKIGALTTGYVPKWNGGSLVNGLIFDTGTNVGIGTSTPTVSLEVNGTTKTQYLQAVNALGTDIFRIQPGNDLNPTYSAITVGNSTWTAWPFQVAKNGNILSTGIISVSGTGNNYLAGNVGIGIATPTTKLNVAGEIRANVSQGNNGLAITDTTNSRTWAWYPNGANTLGLWTTTTGDVMTINSTGSVGIGKNNPGAKLDVNGSVNIPYGQYYKQTNSGGVMFNLIGLDSSNTTHINAPDKLHIHPNSVGDTFLNYNNTGDVLVGDGVSSTRFLVQKGNVGIGTFTPAASLEIKRNVADANFAAWIEGTQASNFGLGVNIVNTTASTAIADLKSGNTSRMYVRADGNIGIGTSSPGVKLDIRGSTAITTASPGVLLNLNDTTSNNVQIGTDANSTYLNTTSATAIRLGTNSSERLRIDTAGNVGISTTTPLDKLHIRSGEILVESASSSNNAVHNGIKFTTDNTNYYSAIRGNRDVNSGRIGMSFFTSNSTVISEMMRLDASGNLGIGTTTPAAKLEVTGNIIASTPTLTNHVATKGYVDTAISASSSDGLSLRFTRSSVPAIGTTAIQKDALCTTEFGSAYVAASALDISQFDLTYTNFGANYFFYSRDSQSSLYADIYNGQIIINQTPSQMNNAQVACIRIDSSLRFTRSSVPDIGTTAIQKDALCTTEFGSAYVAASTLDISQFDLKFINLGANYFFYSRDSQSSLYANIYNSQMRISTTPSQINNAPVACIRTY